jgi:aspartyl-tRNA(Asn)/glutamyl-tRNA(Gln) amidotransferase subunit C
MKITREDVLRVAELAYLKLSEAEVATFQSQLDHILEYAGKLNELDTSKVEPMAQVLPAGAGTTDATLRDDVLIPCQVADAVLAQAPDAKAPYFRVPRVIEK